MIRAVLIGLFGAFLAVSAALAAPTVFGGPPPEGLAFALTFGTALLAGLAAALLPRAETPAPGARAWPGAASAPFGKARTGERATPPSGPENGATKS